MGYSKLTNVIVPASSKNYTKGRTSKITEVCIHHCAGIMTAEQCGKLWQNPKRRCSSNYGIGKDGRIAGYVDENNTAWCNSNWASNCRSISIETSNDKTGGEWHVSDASLNSLIRLVADIAKRNGLGTLVPGKNLTWHSMYTSTTCPGNYLRSKMQYIADEANKINNGSTVVPVPQTNLFLPARGYFKRGDNNSNVGKIASFMYKTFPSYTKRAALGNLYGPNLIASIKEFQRRTGLVSDGCTGPKTLSKLVEYGFRY